MIEVIYSGDLKSGLFEGRALALGAIVPTIQQQNHSKSGHFCTDFKWLGFQISDPIQNPDHLKPNLFLTIQNQD